MHSRSRRTITIGVVLLGVGIVVAFAQLVMVTHRLHTAEDELHRARTAASRRDNREAERRLDRASRNLASARDQTSRFPAALLGHVPWVGTPARAAQAAAAAGRDALSAGRVVLEASDLIHAATGGLDNGNLSALHAAAVQSDDHLARADRLLRAARADMAGPAGAWLPTISGRARAVRAEVDRSRRQLADSRRGIALVADLTASTTQARLLILSQDSLELRPTGGYIGSFGVVSLSGGTVNLETYQATEDLPPPEPPLTPPRDLAMALPAYWGLSNANWWPDFPTSASTARELFRRQGGGDLDGVLALTENAIARLVDAVGPLTLPSYPEPVVADGFDERVVREVELKEPPDQPRKKFLVELSKTLLDQLLHVPGTRVGAVSDAIERSVGAGDVQLWFVDKMRQAQIDGMLVAGQLPPARGDFLSVVDANLTASKANLAVVKRIDYSADRKRDGTTVAHLTLALRNAGPPSRVNPFYNGYMRVYVPLGSRLLSAADGQRIEEASDGPYDVVSVRMLVLPGETKTSTFSYVLPPTVGTAGTYRLTWLRQPGTARDELRVAVGGKNVVANPDQRILRFTTSFRGNNT